MPNYNVTTPVSESGWRDFSRDLFKFCTTRRGQGLAPNAAVQIAGSPHQDAGMKLIDYLLSTETERKLAFSDVAQIPLRPDVATSPGGIETRVTGENHPLRTFPDGFSAYWRGPDGAVQQSFERPPVRMLSLVVAILSQEDSKTSFMGKDQVRDSRAD